jgi:glutamate synthase domain-containing protein 2
MLRRYFIILSVIILGLIAIIAPFKHDALWWLVPAGPLVALGIYDCFSNHNVLRNYPVLGHLRYIMELIRPEMQQYFVESDLSGRPFSREQRSIVYQRAKMVRDTIPFGTRHNINAPNYEFSQHSIMAGHIADDDMRIIIGNAQCSKPYNASRLNISAMSFGAISARAIVALNRGAKFGNFAHNTGEGGLTPHHLQEGGDLIWQIGTAYFGTRTTDGKFCPELFAEKSQHAHVKMIEIKISQGAKPGHGGVLPQKKITPEIAAIRGIPMDRDCISPPSHSAFSTPLEMMRFIQQLRELSGGKPIGFKLCIGIKREFMSICKAMLQTGIYPDFITIDGAEGGTGAAPVEFSNRLGTPLHEALAFVNNCLVGTNLRQHIRLIASAKVVGGFDIAMKIALGADACNMARPMMFALGCIQALRCDSDECPTGIATTNLNRSKALVVKDKARRVCNFHAATIKSFKEFSEAMGAHHPSDIKPQMISYRINEADSITFAELFHFLQPGSLLTAKAPDPYRKDWEAASAEKF